MKTNNQIQANRTEFEKLCRRGYRQAYYMAYHYTGNHSDAEDLTQDAFIRAWVSFEQFKRGCSFDSWLFRILSNLAIDRWRRPGLSSLSLDLISGDHGFVSNWCTALAEPTPGPEQMCLSNDCLEQIKSAIKLLPTTYRDIVYLADIELLSYDEVARETSIPIGTVKSRLHRGRLVLREILTSAEMISID